MNTEEKKTFIKRNRAYLKEIFDEKMGTLIRFMLEADKDNRDKYADSINILRDWLRELEILGKDDLPKSDSFV